MRCPKCHYLSFDPEPRCKNCGYDLDVEESPLSMAPVEQEEPGIPDLPLRTMDSLAKPVALELVKPTVGSERRAAVAEPELVAVGAETKPSLPRRAAVRAPSTTTELPLFIKTIGPMEPVLPAPAPEPERTIDRPVAAGVLERIDLTDHGLEPPKIEADADIEPPTVVSVPPANRPLSVRRPAAEPPRAARVERRVGPLHDDLLEDLRRLEREEARQKNPWPDSAGSFDEETDQVPMSARFGAAALDGLLLGGIGAFVLWATLRLCDASPGNLGAATLVPLGVFLGGVTIAYLLMFTAAGGQTVGKMLMGIRVVDDAPNPADRLTLGQAASRAVLSPLSFAILGLGWVPAFFGRGLALHDRLAHTRVVRA
jgi:uncharacterized RDD family membrane protein YckC